MRLDMRWSSDLWHLLVFSCWCFTCVISHPQCLDFRAPFNPGGLDFCTDYNTFGCCTKEEDTKIKKKYQDILQKMRTRTDVTLWCREFVQAIVCLKCSPYAAHLYGAEATKVISPFPSLCTHTAKNRYNASVNSYCQNFYTNCSRAVIKFMTDDEEIQKSAEKQSSFCSGLDNDDPNYCYPGILEDNSIKSELQTAKSSKEGCVCFEEYGSKLKNPVFVRNAGDGSGFMFVGEQGGLIYIYKNKTKVEEPFLDLVHKVKTSPNPGEERGLLGLAFHPKYSENRTFFVYYSLKEEGGGEKIRVSKFTASEDKSSTNMTSEEAIITVDQPYWNHNGGELIFGEDGYLYVFLGDGGSAGDPMNYSQNSSSYLGKVLRLDVDSGSPYKVPKDNPFIGKDKYRPEIYAYGFRNPWRCSKDRGDPKINGDPDKGRMICGDVGQSKFEEIDIIKKGRNYGWNAMEGFECYQGKICDNIVDQENPIYTYPHSVGQSVIGGYVYRGCLNPKLRGRYVFGDHASSKLFLLKENKSTGKWTDSTIDVCGSDVCLNGLTSDHPPHITSFGEDEDGEIYMVAMDLGKAKQGITDHGKFYKIVDPYQRGNPAECKPAVSDVKPRDKDSFSGKPTVATNRPIIGSSSQPRPAQETVLTALLLCVISAWATSS